MDDHAEHRVEHQRQHAAVHGVVAADMEPAELHAELDAVVGELRDVIRRHQQAAGAGKAGHPVGRTHSLGRLERSQECREFFGPVGGGHPGVAVGIGRHREVLHPADRLEEPAETRTRIRGLELRETAVPVVLRVDQALIAAHTRGARTSRRTMV